MKCKITPAEKLLCRVTLSANAGFSLEFHGHKIWVDALHHGDPPGFSAVTPALLEQMSAHPAFQNPDVVCVTHCHRDHYAPAMLQKALAQWPQAEYLHPAPHSGQGICVGEDGGTYCVGGLKVRYLPLPHAADKKGQVNHFGILLSCQGTNVLVSGDCEVASPRLRQQLGEETVHLAVMNFPWLTLPRGQAYLKEQLKPENLVLCHIPFAEDDLWQYRKAVNRELEKLEPGAPVWALTEPLQSIDIWL